MIKADKDIQYIKGVGEKRAELFHKLGIYTLSDLVHFYPRSYKDLSDVSTIAKAYSSGENSFVEAKLQTAPYGYQVRKGMTVYKAMATDGFQILHITFFNNTYLAKSLAANEDYLFYGKVLSKYNSYEMNVLYAYPAKEKGRIIPVYPQVSGLGSNVISKIMSNALGEYFPEYDLLPQNVKEEYSLCTLGYAIKNIHFPQTKQEIDIAKRRLLFEELLVFQMGMARLKYRDRGQTSYVVKKDYSDEFMSLLTFNMTNAQKNAIYDAIRDMGLSRPMNRLLQGDVGSGKTAVAAGVIYNAVKNKMQSAFMAPTSILASQHYRSLCAVFKDTDIRIELIVGATSAKKKKEIKEKAKNGEVDLIIGTHTLIQADFEFQKLGLVVTDEQHRFGVKQRGSLEGKGDNPHILVMSATPIPRTLGLIIYGDLDISVLDEMPPGRQTIDTYAVDDNYRQRIFAYIKKHLDKGLQGYIVCPLVEESELLEEVTSAKEYFEDLQNNSFRDYKLGLLHGKMKPKEKEKVMEDFAKGEIELLVSTTVIEVGVDVPNAVIMVIENAERFGLSTLHQLRGRVGRGKEKSTCILVSSSKSENTRKRLSIMKKTNDGFKIADEDLRLRGPGDFFGGKQHGLPVIKLADSLEDMVLVKETQKAAGEILKADPKLEKKENAPLKREIEKLFKGENTMN